MCDLILEKLEKGIAKLWGRAVICSVGVGLQEFTDRGKQKSGISAGAGNDSGKVVGSGNGKSVSIGGLVMSVRAQVYCEHSLFEQAF